MTYLHDKNIVHGRLTSVNIYIELNQRVKISLIDHDEVAIAHKSNESSSEVQFNLPTLTYLSPELIRSISRTDDRCDNNHTSPIQIDTNQLTKESDIFSFGTLLFEIFEERFPFSTSDRTTTTISPRLLNYSSTSTPLSYSMLDSPHNPTHHTNSAWNGNIKVSASELIYQIGSGQMQSNNLNKDTKGRCLAPVEQIISACWMLEPPMRPQFKQLSFA